MIAAGSLLAADRPERLRHRDVLLAADGKRVALAPASSGVSAAARSRPERRGAHHAVHREGDVGAGQRLELRGAAIVEQIADAEHAEQLGLIEADGDRHADDFEHA